ncbi:hypothetical protein HAX54_002278 [Datura stramonium]|uniref:Uncharacterized protein n=1 Tax=Datura stramonium TaxID=4076 RepID=A0ABS8T4R7_DATST|nr:hypothetical protein [Datura stramonium]
MGAYQFDKPKHQAMFFNWYIFIFYLCWALSTTFIVYVEDNIGWLWGFGISVASNILGLTIFLAGKQFYRHIKEQGDSPFVNLARVVVAAIQNWREGVPLSEKTQHYYHDASDKTTLTTSPIPTKFFKLSKWIAIWDLISRSQQAHALTIACMVVSALVEFRRLRVARSHHLQGQKDEIVPMSVFWLLP